jgi:hypothetical protein
VAHKAGLGRSASRLVSAGASSGAAAAAAAEAAQEADAFVATLSIQYFGRHGAFADELPGATLSLINTDIPVAVSRMVGEGATLLSRSTLAPDAEAAQEAAQRAAIHVLRSSRAPLLRRNVVSGSAAPAVLLSNALASVATRGGGAIAVTGGDDVLLRPTVGEEGDVQLS